MCFILIAIVSVAGCATSPPATPVSAPDTAPESEGVAASQPATAPGSEPSTAPVQNPHGHPSQGHGEGRGPVLDADTVAAAGVPVGAGAAITHAEIEAHVRTLASDEMEGRGVGTKGLDKAADYIATQFQAAGLSPAGTDGFMQPFEVIVGSTLDADQAQELTIGGETFAVGSQWRPFAFSKSGTVTAPMVFAGYGVRAPDLGYDDYAGLDVKGRIVVVLRRWPRRKSDKDSPFAAAHGMRFSDLRHRAYVAKSLGAKGMIVINDPARYAGKKRDKLKSFRSGRKGHLPIVQLTWRDGGERLAAAIGLDLAREQETIDKGKAPASRQVDATCTIRVSISRVRARVKNVVGVLLPEGVAAASESRDVVVVGAHYDHLGRGGHGSLDPDSEEIHNGADDNASGTALLIELAQALQAQRASLRRPIYFVAFAAEELGLMGAHHFVTEGPESPDRIAAMMNFDMVGRLRGDKLHVGGVGTALEFERLVDAAAQGEGLEIQAGKDGFAASDHSAFYARSVPVLFLFTGAHAEYHTPADDADLVNFAGVVKVGGFAYRALYYLAAAPERPFYTIADRRRGGELGGGSGGRGYGAYLGTVPSFAEFEGKGVLLQGVRAGSPAAKAGVQGGDVIVGIDRATIDDLYEFTYALRDHKPGDRVVVRVRRNEETLELEAVLGERKKKKE
jgi:hypothetical protein